MNQILISECEKTTKSDQLNKNLITIRYFIIILLFSCIILSGILLYRIYNDKYQEDFISDNAKLLINNDNTVVNNIELIEIIDNDIKLSNDISENDIIETNNDKDNNNSNSISTSNTYEPTVYTTPNGEKYTIIAHLKIASLNIDMDVLSSTSNALLKISLNKYWGSDPNKVGNMCIVGHNYENGTHFSNLSKIKLGDIIEITDNSGRTLKYTVYQTNVIDPYDTSCTSQLTNGETEITLITCYNSGKNRFIVKARV